MLSDRTPTSHSVSMKRPWHFSETPHLPQGAVYNRIHTHTFRHKAHRLFVGKNDEHILKELMVTFFPETRGLM